jgi:predicted nuclease with RNAse H fold
MKLYRHIGIDFGSKLAGTTAICWQVKNNLQIVHSAKNQDGDVFIREHIRLIQPESIWIDAPLSLPGIYLGQEGKSDFFYRQSDRELRAMSPMFLGGLTARAMKLKHDIPEVPFYEAYPGKLAKLWDWDSREYKKSKVHMDWFREKVEQETGVKVPLPASFHELDAILAWCIGWRKANGKVLGWGDPVEGLIYA